MTSSRDWDVAVGTGLIRVAAGLALLRFRRTTIAWSGGDPDDPVLRALFTYFGVRDLTLGVTTLAASRPGSDVRRALALQTAADATDGAVISAVTSRGHLPRVRGLGLAALAWGTALADIATALRLGRRV